MSSPGYDFYENVLHSPKRILAPMVEQSELAFRLMCREMGAQLCYTPMWHAAIFVRDERYRNSAIEVSQKDRPLLFQFCANDAETFAEACALAEPHCDGIDLNLGCPQVIAARGHYGAFLMDEWDLVANMVRAACRRVKKPITCKIRVFDDVSKTVCYAQMLERSGAKIITVHGRLRSQKGPKTGVANWEHIKAVKENVSVPVFANGNIQYLADVERCLQHTKVDGVMSAEGALFNPAIFQGRQPPAWEMADKYLDFAQRHMPPLGYVRGHLFRILLHCLSRHQDFRSLLGAAKSFDQLVSLCSQLKQLCQADAEKDIRENRDSSEPGQLPYWRCQPYVRPPEKLQTDVAAVKKDRAITKRKLLKMKHRQNGKGLFPKVPRDKWPLCTMCKVNPWGTKCQYNLCRKCCKVKCETEVLDCPVHKCYFHYNLVKRAK